MGRLADMIGYGICSMNNFIGLLLAMALGNRGGMRGQSWGG